MLKNKQIKLINNKYDLFILIVKYENYILKRFYDSLQNNKS